MTGLIQYTILRDKLKYLFMKNLFLLGAVGVMLLSCQDDLKELPDPELPETSVLSFINPYDTLSVHHGHIIDTYDSLLQINPEYWDLDSLITLSSDYIETNVDDQVTLIQILNTYPTAYNYLVRMNSSSFTIETAISDLDSTFFNGYIAPQVYDYVHEVFLEVRFFTDHQTLLNRISEIENRIYNDNVLSSDEKEYLLAASSLSRASVTYWDNIDNYASNTSTPGWLEKDIVGAYAGYSLGVFHWATMFTGNPLIGGAALVGFGACCSMIPS
jgi:hypothetical protein